MRILSFFALALGSATCAHDEDHMMLMVQDFAQIHDNEPVLSYTAAQQLSGASQIHANEPVLSQTAARQFSGASQRSRGCGVTGTTTLPSWLAKLVGLVTDVEIYCDFPQNSDVDKMMKTMKDKIVKRSGKVILKPGGSVQYQEVPQSKTGADYESADKHMESLKVSHTDVCAESSSFPPASSATQIYNNIKDMVDRFDIFTKCTRVYVPQNANGEKKIEKDNVMGVSVMLANGFYSLSYEDIAHYDEHIEGNDKTLTVVVSSRKENVIEGNYDITVKLRNTDSDSFVDLAYTKRQNFAEVALESLCDNSCYEVATQKSVDKTILKLASAGLYGQDSIVDTGCRVDDSICAHYFILELGAKCTDHEQCSSECCGGGSWWQMSSLTCLESTECSK